MNESIVVGPRHISHSQLNHPCELQLKFHRERVPWLNRGISLLYGSGLHAGLEEWHRSRDLERSIQAATITLHAEIEKDPPVRWDEKRGPNHKAAIPDLLTASSMLYKHLYAWHELRKNWKGRVLEIEKNVWVDITRFDKPWKLQCRIDLIVEEDGKRIIYDYKSAGKAWTPIKLEEHRPQAFLYLGAEWSRTRVAPDLFRFAVFVKGTDQIKFYDTPFDAMEINRYIEDRVRPTIELIESGDYKPNLETWQHDPRYCEYFETVCPFGRAMHPKPEQDSKEAA